MNQQELAAAHARAETELQKIPGVVGVGYGLKEVGGRTTKQIAYRIYVERKKDLAELDHKEVIPEAFEGVRTDVLPVRTVTLTTEDVSKHRPLIGGISITNFMEDASSVIFVGTLGFLATIDGQTGPDNVVLVSNNHVLSAEHVLPPSDAAGVGHKIYQPPHKEDPPGTFEPDQLDKSPIGKIDKLISRANYKFSYPDEEGEKDYYLDCATAKINICISSWCNVNCGISYKNEIRDLNIDGNSQIEGVARVAHEDVVDDDAAALKNYKVFKVGRSTGKTEGIIVDIGAKVNITVGSTTFEGKNVIEVESVDTSPFNDSGDSGAALINDQNQIVGLVFAKRTDKPLRTHACHIHPVLEKLKVTPISTANPPVGPAGLTRGDMQGILSDGFDHTTELLERAAQTWEGTEPYAQALKHRKEVVSLVNQRRPVTVAWHRNNGPLFLSHIMNNARNPTHRIPFEVESINRETLVLEMARALRAHGTPALQAAIDTYFDDVMAVINDFDNLHEFVGRLAQEQNDG